MCLLRRRSGDSDCLLCIRSEVAVAVIVSFADRFMGGVNRQFKAYKEKEKEQRNHTCKKRLTVQVANCLI